MSLRQAAREFSNLGISRRVAARFAMEHPTEESRKKYLKDHPNADPSNHKVKGDGGNEDASAGKPPIKDYVQHTKRLSDTVSKMSDQLGKLEKSFEKATGYKGDKEQAKAVAGKINDAYGHAVGSADMSLHHAQSAINIARKHGATDDEISRVEAMHDDLKKLVEKTKKGDFHKPIEGGHADAFAVGAKAKDAKELAKLTGALHHAVSLLSNG